MAAVRRGRDEKPLPKEKNLCDRLCHRTVTQIENLVGLESQNKNSTVRCAPKMKKKTTKDTKDSGSKVLSYFVEQYDLVGVIVQASAGININQLVRGDVSTTAVKA